MKKFLKNTFPGFVRFYNRMFNHLYHLKFYGKNREKVFSRIYLKNHWRDNETVSGPGSTYSRTENVRKQLSDVIKKYEVDSMVDIPCGDFNWMKYVDLNGLKYIGLDIVPELIQSNLKLHRKVNTDFQLADIAITRIPTVNLIFCRDCFVHLSYSDIKKSIMNIKASKSKYLLTTTFTKHTNYDIITGNWRQINLQATPFNFPAPVIIIEENDEDENEDKSMALWRIEHLPDFK